MPQIENPPAFPVPAASFGPGGDFATSTEGMTLRDYFAAKAMAAILSRATMNGDPDEVAMCAGLMADAMLAERQKGPSDAD